MKMKKIKTGAFASAVLIAASLLIPSQAAQASDSASWEAERAPFTCSARDQYVRLTWKLTGGNVTGYWIRDFWVHGRTVSGTRAGSGAQAIYTGLKYLTYYQLTTGDGSISGATLSCYTAI